MFFKLLIVVMSLLIFDSDSYRVPKDRLPSSWALYRFNVIKALGPKRDVTSINDTDARCQDHQNACTDPVTDDRLTGPGKMKKLGMVNSMDIWRVLAEQSNLVPVILVSDNHKAPEMNTIDLISKSYETID